MSDLQQRNFAINDHFYHFIDDWNYKLYLLVGGYGSSKSYHVAVKLITKLLMNIWYSEHIQCKYDLRMAA